MQSRNAVGLVVILVGLTSVVALWAADQQASPANRLDLTVASDGKVSMCYRHGGNPIKPYVRELRTPSGVNILRDAPSDHLHHHALMFAVAVDGVNFWEERGTFGRQVETKFDGMGNVGLSEARAQELRGWKDASWRGCVEGIQWVGPADPKPLLEETRAVQVVRAPDLKATLLTWQSRLSVPKGKESARITGANYFGLGMRFVESMDKGGKFINADGKAGVKDTNAHRSTWCAYIATADGKPVTVAMFDSPKNFRHPATWFTMEKPFAYLCATMNLSKEPFEIQQGKPLLLRYGVALWDGTTEPKEIEQVYQQWATLPVLKDGAIASIPAE